MKPEFAEYQKRVVVNAKVLADALTEAGYRIVSAARIRTWRWSTCSRKDCASSGADDLDASRFDRIRR